MDKLRIEVRLSDDENQRVILGGVDITPYVRHININNGGAEITSVSLDLVAVAVSSLPEQDDPSKQKPPQPQSDNTMAIPKRPYSNTVNG